MEDRRIFTFFIFISPFLIFDYRSLYIEATEEL